MHEVRSQAVGCVFPGGEGRLSPGTAQVIPGQIYDTGLKLPAKGVQPARLANWKLRHHESPADDATVVDLLPQFRVKGQEIGLQLLNQCGLADAASVVTEERSEQE